MPSTPPDPIGPPSDVPPILSQTLRRRIRGYAVYSDEEPCSSGEDEEEPKPPLSFSHFTESCEEKELTHAPSGMSQVVRTVQTWIAASIIPLHTKQIDVLPPYDNPAERIVSTFTLYGELKKAHLASEYQPIFERLQKEWQYVGGLVSCHTLQRS
jgi:hypothetical protein